MIRKHGVFVNRPASRKGNRIGQRRLRTTDRRQRVEAVENCRRATSRERRTASGERRLALQGNDWVTLKTVKPHQNTNQYDVHSEQPDIQPGQFVDIAI